MKHIKLLALAALLTGFAACDNVDEGERYIETPKATSTRTVLIEDFTGQFCVNCPRAHETMNSLIAQYGEQVIAVSIHAGNDVNAMDESYGGLRNADGAAYGEKWNIQQMGFPKGIINRHTAPLNDDAWGKAVSKELETDASAELTVNAKLSAGGSKIDITTNIKPLDNIEGKLQLWIIENGIIALQQKSDGFDMSYEHNHVFRGAVNGLWGEDISLKLDSPVTKEHSMAVKTGVWNTANLEVVAFVYNDKDGVIQAAQCKVVE